MLLYIALNLVKRIQKKRKESLRARISREIKHANREVFSTMDANERKEMMKVINTTVLNAELFKKNNVKVLEQLFPLKRKNRNSEKKVVFKLPVKGN